MEKFEESYIIRVSKKKPYHVVSFINNLNKQHKSNMFGYGLSSSSMPFLDTMVYKEED